MGESEENTVLWVGMNLSKSFTESDYHTGQFLFFL